jgi:uncharacterized protein (DUF1800 family)
MKTLFLLIGVFGVARISMGDVPRVENAPVTDKQKIVHVLNRLGYGPRPGDIERVAKLGVDKYIRQQLQPEQIVDDAVEKKLAVFDTLTMPTDVLIKSAFAETKDFVERQKAMGGAAEMRTRFGLDVGKPEGAAESAPASPMNREEMLKTLPTRLSLRAVGELQAAKVLRAVESERQLQEVLVDFWGNHFNIDVKKAYCRVLKVADEREAIRPHVLGKFRDLLAASAKSPAMLLYLDNSQNSAPREMGIIEQKIRAEYQKKLFGIALEATGDKPRMDGGLNENYGREILELHTLGVDGGYTQKDVVEVARCFTGWGYHPLTGDFQFNPRRHDQGEKNVLGQHIPANGGIQDGEQVLDILAHHPSTAKFIATKLCQRFIADEPPASVVEHAARVFRESDGDLRQVVEAIVTSPEFFSEAACRNKIKSPFEFAVSAVRALGGRIYADEAGSNLLHARSALEGAATIGYGQEFVSGFKRKSLNWHISEMGMPLYAYQAPTGWPEDSRKWVSAGALIARLNFALALTGKSVADVLPPTKSPLAGVDADKPDAVLDQLIDVLLSGEVSDTTRATLKKQVGDADNMASTVDAPKLIALVLGSPEFQRR